MHRTFTKENLLSVWNTDIRSQSKTIKNKYLSLAYRVPAAYHFIAAMCTTILLPTNQISSYTEEPTPVPELRFVRHRCCHVDTCPQQFMQTQWIKFNNRNRKKNWLVRFYPTIFCTFVSLALSIAVLSMNRGTCDTFTVYWKWDNILARKMGMGQYFCCGSWLYGNGTFQKGRLCQQSYYRGI